MNKSTSLYLDFLRVIAAFGVLFVHANLSWFSNSLFLPEELGHKLVMVFFVLSGYLIAFTVDKKNKGSQKYLVDRLSRLYSVVLPALIFTYIIDFIGNHYNPTFYAGQVAPDHQILRFLLNATFLSQVWGLSTKPSSNGPFWSIPYEFWYYMLFWAFTYLKSFWRYIGIVLICLIVGLKILILFPVWLFGVIVYRVSCRIQVNQTTALGTFLFTILSIIVLTFFWDFSVFSDSFIFGRPPLFFSSRFAFDWVYGALMAINILSVSYLNFGVVPQFIEKSIKSISSITFSLYLYHLPLLVFFAAVLPYNKSNYFIVISIILIIVAIVTLLSQITEKERKKLNIIIERIFLLFKTNKALTKEQDA